MQSIWLALNLAFLRDAVTIVRKNLGRVCLSRFTLYPATICLSLSLQPFFFLYITTPLLNFQLSYNLEEEDRWNFISEFRF